jgi:hypothetical protein
LDAAIDGRMVTSARHAVVSDIVTLPTSARI